MSNNNHISATENKARDCLKWGVEAVVAKPTGRQKISKKAEVDHPTAVFENHFS